MLIIRFILIFTFWSSLAPLHLWSNSTALPFLPGEKLEYDLSWGIFPIGHASLEVAFKEISSNEPWEIRFFVRTNDFADAIYKVRTEITSWVDSNFTKSLRYIKSQQEGKTKKEIEVDFDYNQRKVIYSEKGREPLNISLNKKVFDPLAIAYAFRYRPVGAGGQKVLPTSDGKKLIDVTVTVGETEKVRVPFGSFQANDVIPNMKTLSGVFKKSPKGILRVWYSNDKRRIPIKISSKVVVGSFTAKLKNAKSLQKP